MDYAVKLDAIHDDVLDIRGRVAEVEGRVLEIEYDLRGHPTVRLPSGERDRGIKGTLHDHDEVVSLVRRSIRVGKWLILAFGTATIALVGNLVAGRIG